MSPKPQVGDAVSAKYKGSSCSATVKQVIEELRISIILNNKEEVTVATLKDGDAVEGNAVVITHPKTGKASKGVVKKVNRTTTYAVVFDDGDEHIVKSAHLLNKQGTNGASDRRGSISANSSKIDDVHALLRTMTAKQLKFGLDRNLFTESQEVMALEYLNDPVVASRTLKRKKKLSVKPEDQATKAKDAQATKKARHRDRAVEILISTDSWLARQRFIQAPNKLL